MTFAVAHCRNCSAAFVVPRELTEEGEVAWKTIDELLPQLNCCDSINLIWTTWNDVVDVKKYLDVELE